MKLRGYLYFLFLASAILGCEPQEKDQQNGPFPHFPDLHAEQKLLKLLPPNLNKTLIENSDTFHFEGKINWNKEFAPFLEADINKHSFRDEYRVTETGKKVIYTAMNPELPIREVTVGYPNQQAKNAGEWSSVYIKRTLKTFFYASEQELYYERGVAYRIKGAQQIRFIQDRSYRIEGVFTSFAKNDWQGQLDLGETTLPFHFTVQRDKNNISVTFHNGDEVITTDEVTLQDDSLFIRMPVYDSEIRARMEDDFSLKGFWQDHTRPDYKIPFSAQKTAAESMPQAAVKDLSGKWEVVFSKGTPDQYHAIGIFEQDRRVVYGTFLTETGDYRYLEGHVSADDSLQLSCFDGAHAFLFKAGMDEKGRLNGLFWSGMHWKEPWVARKNEKASLTAPDSLTFLKEGYDKLAFTFPDLDSQLVSLSDEKYRDKVIIVQLMGSWCPNCRDETAFFTSLYKEYREQGLEIIALAFERNSSHRSAIENLQRYKKSFHAKYDFLLAGPADKKKAEEALPMLNHIISFPTSIFIDRQGTVRKIHTGFYGPGTGAHYEQYVKDTREFIEELLGEEGTL